MRIGTTLTAVKLRWPEVQRVGKLRAWQASRVMTINSTHKGRARIFQAVFRRLLILMGYRISRRKLRASMRMIHERIPQPLPPGSEGATQKKQICGMKHRRYFMYPKICRRFYF